MQPLIIYRLRTSFPSQQAHTVQAIHTADALARAGAEVWLYAAEYTSPTPAEVLGYYGLAENPNLKLRLPLQWTKRSRRWKGKLIGPWEWWSFARVANRRPVFYIRNGQDNHEYAQHVAAMRKKWNARVVVEMHRVRSMELEEFSRPDAPAHLAAEVNDRMRAQAGHEAAALLAADGVTAICATLADAIREICPSIGDIGIVHSGSKSVSTQDTPLAQRKGIVYAGQLYGWKGVFTLVDAMAQVPGETLTMVGGKDEADIVAVRERARALGIEDRIRLVGYVPHHEVAKYLATARCAVIPLGTDIIARRFTSPMKAFEYMASGTPIVAADLPTVREILRHEESALLAPPEDAAAMAQQIKRMMSDDALAERLRQQARKDLAQYTWDERAKRILSFIETIPAPRDKR